MTVMISRSAGSCLRLTFRSCQDHFRALKAICAVLFLAAAADLQGGEKDTFLAALKNRLAIGVELQVAITQKNLRDPNDMLGGEGGTGPHPARGDMRYKRVGDKVLFSLELEQPQRSASAPVAVRNDVVFNDGILTTYVRDSNRLAVIKRSPSNISSSMYVEPIAAVYCPSDPNYDILGLASLEYSHAEADGKQVFRSKSSELWVDPELGWAPVHLRKLSNGRVHITHDFKYHAQPGPHWLPRLIGWHTEILGQDGRADLAANATVSNLTDISTTDGGE